MAQVAVLDDLDQYLIRSFPNEDVVFWRKPAVDNSGVVRQGDPGVAEKCWRFFSIMSVLVVVVVGLLMPNAYGLMSEIRLERLQARNEDLKKQFRLVTAAEQRLVNLERLNAQAPHLGLRQVSPDRVFHYQGVDPNRPVEARRRNRR